MARTFSTSIYRAMYSQNTSGYFPILLDITHDYSGISSPVYLCNNATSLTYAGHTYAGFPFKFDPPDLSRGSGVTNASITFDATDQTIIEIVRGSTTAPIIVCRAMYYNDAIGDSQFVELIPWKFTFKNISWGIDSVQGELIYEDRWGNQMGPIEYSTLTAPGVH